MGRNVSPASTITALMKVAYKTPEETQDPQMAPVTRLIIGHSAQGKFHILILHAARYPTMKG